MSDKLSAAPREEPKLSTSHTPAHTGVLILGAGHAGMQAAATLRQHGYDRAILLVDRQRGLPYQRPPLSKEVLAQGTHAESPPLRPASFFEKHAVMLLDGRRAVAIDPAGHTVTLDAGDPIAYEHLILASGASPRPLSMAGAALAGVHTLDTQAGALEMRDRLTAGARLVIVGGGFIGLEVAAAAARREARVVVLEAQARVMERVVLPATSAHFSRLHEAAGVQIRLESVAKRIVGDDAGKVVGVELDSGETLDADTVLASIGVAPNDELAAAAGIDARDGIVVDRYLRTSAPDVYAIGDCARLLDPATATDLRLESVQNATDQARAVAATIAGQETTYEAVPWFWSTQYGCRLQIAGLALGSDEHVIRGESEDSFSIFCFRNGRLLAVESVDRPSDHLAARRLLEAKAALTPAEAADVSVDLRAPVMPARPVR